MQRRLIIASEIRWKRRFREFHIELPSVPDARVVVALPPLLAPIGDMGLLFASAIGGFAASIEPLTESPTAEKLERMCSSCSTVDE